MGITEKYLLQNKFVKNELPTGGHYFEMQISKFEIFYVRPCYLGGFFWGIKDLTDTSKPDFEPYDSQPIETLLELKFVMSLFSDKHKRPVIRKPLTKTN